MKEKDRRMKVACYCRVSHRSQKHDSQRAEIQKWLDSNGIDPAQVEWYLDKETGKTLNRPEFERLEHDIFHGQVKTVVLWKLDRLSRRLVDGVNVLARWCERGLKIVVVTQQLEFDGPVGKTLAAIVSVWLRSSLSIGGNDKRQESKSPKRRVGSRGGRSGRRKPNPNGRRNCVTRA